MKTTKTKKQQPKVTAIGSALRALGGIGGGALGGMFGAPTLGSAAGTSLGGMVSKWLGQGDYVLNSNSLVNKFRSSGDIPNMHANGQAVVVRHREYVADVSSNINFTVNASYALNPGLASSFPWLSGIAQQYQEYSWKGIIYEFVSTSGDVVASTNTALGTVMLATDYRATQSAFTNKLQLLNQYFSCDAKPSECFCHPIECNPKENPYNVQYVRGGAVPAGEDQKTYDLGVVYLATQGMQAASIDVGELWVSYEVELRKPIPADISNLYGLDASYTIAAPDATNVFGTSRTSKYDRIGLTLTNTKLSFPVGSSGSYGLVVTYPAVTSANFQNWITSGTLVNCTAGTLGSTNGQDSLYTVGIGAAMGFCIITITNPTIVASFAPSFTTLTGASATVCAIWVMQVGPTDT
jgi:hypothetical protein